MDKKLTVEELSVFCKKKGFIYQSSEIYGGLSGVYDYGHLGTSLKNNWCSQWKKSFLRLDKNFVEIDTGNIMHENVFKASGHLENFFDPIVNIEGSDQTYRADHLIEEKLGVRAEELTLEEMKKKIEENKLLGDIDYSKIKVEKLNMMFPVHMGPKKGTTAYLRPETAQNPFVNFKIQYELQRSRLPMGLAQIGKAYRNEIAPRNLVLRTRELEQAELQIFFNPNKIDEHEDFENIKDYKLLVMLKDARDKKPVYTSCKDMLKTGLPKFYVYHMAKVQQFYFDMMKISPDNFRFYELNEEEKAFYNKFHFDIEIKLNSTGSWTEVGGVHYRTDHDLKGHQNISKVKMEIFDESTKERFIPHVLELSFGVGRNVYTLLDQNYKDDKERGNLLLSLPPVFSPYSVAVFPLMGKDPLTPVAEKIYEGLVENDINAYYDTSGSVGRRYARQDEIGTPYCVTVDYESVEEGELKGTVTIRDRDSTQQKRVKIEDVSEIVKDLLKEKISFKDL